MESPNWAQLVLPSTHLNNRLPGIFDPGRITNSYKFCWFLALIDFAEKGDDYSVSVSKLVESMVVQVWYPVCFFRLNFGKQDKLARAVDLVREKCGLAENASEEQIRGGIKDLRKDGEVRNALRDLGKFVPFRLLSPWFSRELKGLTGNAHHNRTVQLALDYAYDPARMPLYRFEGERNQIIRINYEWYWYLKDHAEILRKFAFWHLEGFLQKRNPNTPNLREKLKPPSSRKLDPARKLWKGYLAAHPATTCIFSQQLLTPFSMDHFLPWSFVAHDQLWNLLPVPKTINSSKGNRLPDQAYIQNFAQLQHQFFRYLTIQKREKAIEDYVGFFNADPVDLAGLKSGSFMAKMTDLLTPQFTYARNMGFVNW